MNTPPALVVFDLYGTLVRFGVMHHPFRKILLWAREQGRKPQSDDARRIMTANKECEELLTELGIFPPAAMLAQLHREIQEELGSLTLFDDVLPTLSALLNTGTRLAICSNLAKPYGAVIDNLLPPHIDLIRCLSYEVGAIKPEQEIYDWIVRKSGVPAKQTLFVGDTRLADYDGPIKASCTPPTIWGRHNCFLSGNSGAMVKRQALESLKTQFIYINQLVVSDLAQISRMTADPLHKHQKGDFEKIEAGAQ